MIPILLAVAACAVTTTGPARIVGGIVGASAVITSAAIACADVSPNSDPVVLWMVVFGPAAIAAALAPRGP